MPPDATAAAAAGCFVPPDATAVFPVDGRSTMQIINLTVTTEKFQRFMLLTESREEYTYPVKPV